MNAEILAPVGAKQQLIAAVNSGADAVYLGAKGFNARRNADNFEEDTLRETVSFCHTRNVKVYVTLNIVVMDSEIDELLDTIKEVALSGADAVIVQDLAVAKLVRECAPSLPLHASTQMTVHNLAGAKELESLGFSRVVLARELTIEEIKEIADNTNLEIEVFVHGALCMCMSGMCYLSSMLGTRSGNRGLCAQPCRLDFSIGNKKYALSLKDNTAAGLTKELVEAGVTSFKIEGRMKRPEYVAAAVTAFKNELNGGKADVEELGAIFSRSGFTNGYLLGKRDREMFGIRTKEDVDNSMSILKKMQSLYKNEYKKVPVEASLKLLGDEVKLSFNNEEISLHGAVDAINKPLDYDTALRLVSKLGDTPLYIKSFDFENNENKTAPASLINELRRKAAEIIMEKTGKTVPHNFALSSINKKEYEAGETKLRVRLEKLSQLSEFEGAEKIMIPVFELSKLEKIDERIIGEIPAVFFSKTQKKLEEILPLLKTKGLKALYCENIGAINLAKKFGFEVYGGASLNITNSISLSEYENLGVKDATLSFELKLGKASHLYGNIKRGIIGYGFLPLMRFRACPVRNVTACNKCTGKNELTDRMGKKFTVLCQRREFSVLLNSTPLYIGDKEIKNLDFITLYFTKETKEEAKAVFTQFKNGEAPDFERTNGLYQRDLL